MARMRFGYHGDGIRLFPGGLPFLNMMPDGWRPCWLGPGRSLSREPRICVVGCDRRGEAAGFPEERPRVGGAARLDERTPMMYFLYKYVND